MAKEEVKKLIKEGNNKFDFGKEKSKPKEQKPAIIIKSTQQK